MDLKHTPLFKLHQELGAKLVPFAGYNMPVSYPQGIIQEHLQTRSKAGLFDVSHMGQIMLRGDDVARQLESILPIDVEALAIGQQSYALFTNTQGGIIDDLMLTRMAADEIFMVVNAACKEKDLQHLQQSLPTIDIEYLDGRGLLALQGPEAKTVMSRYLPDLDRMAFMQGMVTEIEGVRCYINRCGYTGEDGFEISLPAEATEAIAKSLLGHEEVMPIGLGARDSLRLEVGLCLYGHELNDEITPVEAALIWSISKSRRAGGSKAGGFPGADLILQQMQTGVSKKRIGLILEGRMAAREGITLTDQDGKQVGEVCSGGFAPTLGAPISMAYVDPGYAAIDTVLHAQIRNKAIPARVCKMPFVPQQYYRL